MTTYVVSDASGWVALGSSGLPNSGVAAGTYGDSAHVAQVTVNAQGQVTAASNVAVAGGGGGGGITNLFDQTVASTLASFSVTPIAGTYIALLIEATLRSDFAGTGDFGAMTFNSDSTANYYYQYVAGTAGSPSAGSGNPANYVPLAANGAGATAGAFGTTRADLHNYAGATLKVGQQQRGQIQTIGTDTSYVGMLLTFVWNSTAAITRIDCAPGGGGTVWAAGSRFTVWGLS